MDHSNSSVGLGDLTSKVSLKKRLPEKSGSRHLRKLFFKFVQKYTTAYSTMISVIGPDICAKIFDTVRPNNFRSDYAYI